MVFNIPNRHRLFQLILLLIPYTASAQSADKNYIVLAFLFQRNDIEEIGQTSCSTHQEFAIRNLTNSA